VSQNKTSATRPINTAEQNHIFGSVSERKPDLDLGVQSCSLLELDPVLQSAISFANSKVY
jgi:hypothetical protein